MPRTLKPMMAKTSSLCKPILSTSFLGDEALRLITQSQPVSQPVDTLASSQVERESAARVHVVHDLGFLDKPHTNGVDQQRKLSFTRRCKRVAGERGLDLARDTAHLEVVAVAESLAHSFLAHAKVVLDHAFHDRPSVAKREAALIITATALNRQLDVSRNGHENGLEFFHFANCLCTVRAADAVFSGLQVVLTFNLALADIEPRARGFGADV